MTNESGLGELQRFREKMTALRERADQINAGSEYAGPRLQVTAYYGQSVIEEDESGIKGPDDD